jgi:hypothetical protein
MLSNTTVRSDTGWIESLTGMDGFNALCTRMILELQTGQIKLDVTDIDVVRKLQSGFVHWMMKILFSIICEIVL